MMLPPGRSAGLRRRRHRRGSSRCDVRPQCRPATDGRSHQLGTIRTRKRSRPPGRRAGGLGGPTTDTSVPPARIRPAAGPMSPPLTSKNQIDRADLHRVIIEVDDSGAAKRAPLPVGRRVACDHGGAGTRASGAASPRLAPAAPCTRTLAPPEGGVLEQSLPRGQAGDRQARPTRIDVTRAAARGCVHRPPTYWPALRAIQSARATPCPRQTRRANPRAVTTPASHARGRGCSVMSRRVGPGRGPRSQWDESAHIEPERRVVIVRARAVHLSYPGRSPQHGPLPIAFMVIFSRSLVSVE